MHRKVIIVIGPSGSGKTHEVAKIVKTRPRVATFDMMRDEQYLSEGTVVVIGQPLTFAEAISPDKETFRVVYHPVIIEPLDNGLVESPEFEPLVKLCHLRGDMYLVIDEAHLWCNSRNCPKELMMASLVGRHREFSLILIGQSFSMIHPAIRRNVDEFYTWKTVEPADLEAIRERCGKEVEEQVRQLRATEVNDDNEFVAAGQMLHWTKAKGVVEVTE
jgi:AAA domain